MPKKILIGLLILLAGAAIFFVVTFNQMTNEVETNAPIKDGMEERIVFFDIGNGDRLYLAQLIDSIQACNPKVLAIDVYFKDLKNPVLDSILMKSLNRDNIVLATRHDGREPYAAHEDFLKQVNSYGYAQSIQRGRFTIDAFYLSQNNTNHFAYEIANKFDPEAAKSFKESNKEQPIEMVFTRLEQQFEIYDFKDFNFDCKEIEGKIAYMGYFGKEEDLHITKARFHKESKWFMELEGEPDMHGSVGVANQILMILDQVE